MKDSLMVYNMPLILLADDSSDDCKIVQMALKRLDIPCVLKTVPDGEALLQTLKGLGEPLQDGELPTLILLDLNLPIKNGLEALQEIKEDPRLNSIPVIIWSTSENPSDISQSYKLGSNTFFTKPDSFDQVVETLRELTHYWLTTAKLPDPPPQAKDNPSQ
jgi:two-component system response regulator